MTPALAAAREALARHPIFAQASPAARDRLAERSTLRRYVPGASILAHGEKAETIFLLVGGRVRVFHASDKGEQVTLKIFEGPAIFGEAEALTGVSYFENVAAVTASDVLLMPVAEVLAVMRAEAACAVRFLLDVAARFSIAIQNQKSLAFDPVTVRLANYLLSYGLWTNDEGARELRIELTQDELAAAICATRRSVASDFIAWQKQGILERAGKYYRIKDVAALRRHADPNHLGLTYSLEQDVKPLKDRK